MTKTVDLNNSNTHTAIDQADNQTVSLNFPIGLVKSLYKNNPSKLGLLSLLSITSIAAYSWLAAIYYASALEMFVLNLRVARIQFGAISSAVTNFFLPLALLQPLAKTYIKYYREYQAAKNPRQKAIILGKCFFTTILAAICVPPYISFGESVKDHRPEIDTAASQIDLFVTVLLFHVAGAQPITDLLFAAIEKAYIEPIQILLGSKETITLESENKKLPSDFKNVLLTSLHSTQEQLTHYHQKSTHDNAHDAEQPLIIPEKAEQWHQVAALTETLSVDLNSAISLLAKIYFSLKNHSLDTEQQNQSQLFFFGAWGLSFFGFVPYLIVTALFPVKWVTDTCHIYWPVVTYLTSFMTFSLCAYSADTFNSLIDMLHHAIYQFLSWATTGLAKKIKPKSPGNALLMHTQTKTLWFVGTLITGLLAGGSIAPTLMLSREYFIKGLVIDILIGASTWIFNEEAWGALTQTLVEMPFLITEHSDRPDSPASTFSDTNGSTAIYSPLLQHEPDNTDLINEIDNTSSNSFQDPESLTQTSQALSIRQHIACEKLIKLTLSEISSQTEADQRTLICKLYQDNNISPPQDQTFAVNTAAVYSHTIPSYTVLLTILGWIIYAIASENTVLFDHTLLDHAAVFLGLFLLMAVCKLPHTTSVTQLGINMKNDFANSVFGGLFSFASLAFMHYLYYKNADILEQAKIAEQIPTPIFIATGALFTTAKNALETKNYIKPTNAP